MPTDTIKIEFSGPKGSEKSRTASKLQSMLQVSGKIVRYYDLDSLKGTLPDPLPQDCDYIIIVRS